MHFIGIQTEQTTAITDIMLGFISLFLVFKILSIGRHIDMKKVNIWSWSFALLAMASFLGAVAHGIEMTKSTNFWIWQPINLFLGIAIALFVIGVVYDMRKFSIPKGFLVLMLALSIVFYIITIIIPGSFLVFILYEAVAMIFALVSYVILTWRRTIQGAIYMVFGIFLSIVAAVIQSTEFLHIKVIWEFDYNGVFHIIQIFAMLFLLTGLRKELLSRKN